jgi:folate-binding protein YgfZ
MNRFSFCLRHRVLKDCKLGRWNQNQGLGQLSALHTAITEIEPRTLLRVSGKDSIKFLQGMVTNNVEHCRNRGDAMHICFLTPKGRIQHDAILVCETEDVSSFIVDCAASQATALLNHLRRFKLRSKVTLEDLSKKYSVYVAMPEQTSPKDASQEIQRAVKALLNAQDENIESDLSSPPIAYIDPREASLGCRLITPSKNLDLIQSFIVPKLEGEGFTVTLGDNRHEYEALCYIHGIISGDIISGRIPLECNMEWTNAIAFDKGCYLGQELVARTHFKGQVRKRMIPFYAIEGGTEMNKIAALALASLMTPTNGSILGCFKFLANTEADYLTKTAETDDLDIMNLETGKVVGKIETSSGYFNVGVAQIRLEHIFATEDGSNLITKDTIFVLKSKPHIRIIPYFPHWWGKNV